MSSEYCISSLSLISYRYFHQILHVLLALHYSILSEVPSNYLPRLIPLGQAPPGAPSSCREVKVQQRSLRGSFLALTAAGHSSALTASCPSPRSLLHKWFCSSGILYRFGLVLSNQLAPVSVFARCQKWWNFPPEWHLQAVPVLARLKMVLAFLECCFPSARNKDFRQDPWIFWQFAPLRF